VIAAVLAANSNASSVSLQSSIDALRAQSILAAGAAEKLQAAVPAEGALRLLPGTFSTDGFFIALLERQR